MLGRLGLGQDAESLVERFRFAVGAKGGAVGIALSRQQELVLSRDWDLRPEEAATLKTVGASTLVVLPVVVKGVLVGCMYFDRLARDGPARGHHAGACPPPAGRRRPGHGATEDVGSRLCPRARWVSGGKIRGFQDSGIPGR